MDSCTAFSMGSGMPFTMRRPVAEGESLGQLQKGWVAQQGVEAVGISPCFEEDTCRMLLQVLATLALVANDATAEKKRLSARQKSDFLLEANMVQRCVVKGIYPSNDDVRVAE